MKNKKILINVLVIIICIAICIGCYFLYNSLTHGNTETVKKAAEEKISTDPLFTDEDYPIVDGSTATIPLAEAFEANFKAKKIDEVEINHSKTHNAYVKLIDGEVDLILVTEPSEDALELAKENDVELEVIKVVNEAFVFFINSNNSVKDLTLEQIQDIYTGEITNWKEVGGDDEKIIAYQRPVNSGSQTGMLSLVMKGKKIADAPTENIAMEMSDIIDVVSDYENNSGAIGYSYYYYANTMYLSDEIELLAVNGVKPNNDTIKEGKYPIQTAYYIVIRKDEPENSKTRKLVEAMLSTRGQLAAENAGYVPLGKGE